MNQSLNPNAILLSEKERTKPGDCEWCGEWSSVTISGFCEACRNQFNIVLPEKRNG